MSNYSCSQYSSCNASLCPLDKNLSIRTYKRGEAICFYMLEYVKPNSYYRFMACHRQEIYKVISQVIKEVLSTHSYIKSRLERASVTPSRMVVKDFSTNDI